MAENNKTEKQIPNNVIQLGPSKCCGEGCNKKPEKAGFCGEHFEWFKAGLLTKEGNKAADFEKKHYHFMKGKKSAA
ncbi:MAG: hypothetical protein ACXWRE_05520 [Pseudobdellovibrionaceae bacterium]